MVQAERTQCNLLTDCNGIFITERYIVELCFLFVLESRQEVTRASHHVDEVGEDALNLVDVHVLHLHHLQHHEEGVQRKLMGIQQMVPADQTYSLIETLTCTVAIEIE